MEPIYWSSTSVFFTSTEVLFSSGYDDGTSGIELFDYTLSAQGFKPLTAQGVLGQPSMEGHTSHVETDYELIYDRLETLVRSLFFPIVVDDSPLGVTVLKEGCEPSSLVFDLIGVDFGFPPRANMRTLGWTTTRKRWSMTLVFPHKVALDSLERAFSDESTTYVPSPPGSSVDDLRILAQQARVRQPKTHESDVGTSVTFTIVSQAAHQPF